MSEPNLAEVREKERRLRAFLEGRNLVGVVLARQSSFSWLTCGGRGHVSVASERAVAPLLVTRERKYALTDNIEAARLAEEELAGQGFEVVSHLWFESNGSQALARLCSGPKVADLPIFGLKDASTELARLRYSLTPWEVDRYRSVGRIAAEAMEEAVMCVQPGLTEYQVGARLAAEVMGRGADPIVVLVGADKRLPRHRHPLPTDNPVRNQAMLVLCARKWGLIASLTRLVHFGPLNEELKRRQEACAQVDGAFILSTKPGASVAEIFVNAAGVYRETGFPDEWHLHHQGGATGYETRSYKATPTIEETVQANQAFAWNPSITGTKSEDTILATAKGPEVLTATAKLPTAIASFRGTEIARPAILER